MMWMTFFAENAWKGTAILAAAFALGAILRGSSGVAAALSLDRGVRIARGAAGGDRCGPQMEPRGTLCCSARPCVYSAAGRGGSRRAGRTGQEVSRRPNWPLLLWMVGSAAAAAALSGRRGANFLDGAPRRPGGSCARHAGRSRGLARHSPKGASSRERLGADAADLGRRAPGRGAARRRLPRGPRRA